MNKLIWSVVCLLAISLPAFSQESGKSAAPEPVSFITVGQGQLANNGEELAGGPPVIRDRETWKGFWEGYTENSKEREELPDVDFDSEMIIVSSFGEVSGVFLDSKKRTIRVVAGKTEIPDSTAPSTTHFHIIKVAKLEFKSVVFDHPKSTRNVGADLKTSKSGGTGGLRQGFSAAALAPSCVRLTQWDEWRWYGWRTVAKASNNCSYHVRIKMIWAWAADGACTDLDPGWAYRESRGRQAYVSELVKC